MEKKLKAGDKLTSAFECFDINGSITVEKDQVVVIREVESTPGHYSRICPDIWQEEKITAFKLVDIYGSWKADTFKEFIPTN